MADVRAEVAVNTMTNMLTEYELCAIQGLLSLNGSKRPRYSRDVRALDDWNGAGRLMRGVGVSTMRKRSATHAVRHAHAVAGTAAADKPRALIKLSELGTGDGAGNGNR